MGKIYIKTKISVVLSEMYSSPSTSIQVLVYFGHMLLFVYDFGYKLCTKQVYMS